MYIKETITRINMYQLSRGTYPTISAQHQSCTWLLEAQHSHTRGALNISISVQDGNGL